MIRRLKTRVLGLVAIPLAALALVGCQQKPSAQAAPAPVPTASIHDLMLGMVDPAADVIWGSIASHVDAHGETAKQPRTPEDWEMVRRAALTLSEAPNLLVMPGRRVAFEGQTLSDSQAPGILTADQIQIGVDSDHAEFGRRAKALQDLGIRTLAAANAKDVPALMEVAGDIDDACENCHLRFWYPKNARPTAPAAVGSLKQRALAAKPPA
jgi:cytochrome c556